METDLAKYSTAEVEDGELSDSDGGYTPLQRPGTKPHCSMDHQPTASSTSALKMDEVEDNTFESDISSDESSSGSDDVVKALTRDSSKRSNSKKKRPTAQLRAKPGAAKAHMQQSTRPKKYNVWAEGLQEESLMENMRGFDVAKDRKNDRSVETYDYELKYRLNGENRLKRRISSSETDFSADQGYGKRSRQDGRSIKDRLGRRSSSGSVHNAPRDILDLGATDDDSREDVGREIANKLYEEKDDLMIRVAEVLGNKMAMELFKETQRIEKDGGMMIMNGRRRRTPGGVYLFLLKQDDKISADDKKAIFHEEVKKVNKNRQAQQACKRDQKVEELKKRLNIQDKELKPMAASHSDIVTAMSHLKPDTNGTLSNPPPSPVTNSGQENSPDYSSLAINHVNDNSPEKAILRTLDDLEDDSLTAYDDDFLDMHCDDMDLF